MAAESGVRNLKWLYLGTLGAMLVVSLAFAAITVRFPRRKFIPYAYRFFAVNLVIFYVLFRTLPDPYLIWLGRVYFVWVSVFALFVVSVFWSFMADMFTNAQGKRLFAYIAVGGTMGQICGSLVAGRLAGNELQLGALLVSAFLLEAACWCVRRLNALGAAGPRSVVPTPIGGTALDGIKRLLRSPYLLGIALFMFCYTTTSTFLYGTKVGIVAERFAGQSERVEFFATVDLATGLATVLAQIFLTSRLIARFGVGVTLGALPIITLVGFALLGLALKRPEVFNVFWILVAFEAVRRAGNFAISRPAREVLYTVVSREDKYKTKNVIDTVIYRTGDQVGIWTYSELLVPFFTVAAVCFAVVPLAAGWFAVALLLGRKQRVLAEK